MGDRYLHGYPFTSSSVQRRLQLLLPSDGGGDVSGAAINDGGSGSGGYSAGVGGGSISCAARGAGTGSGERYGGGGGGGSGGGIDDAVAAFLDGLLAGGGGGGGGGGNGRCDGAGQRGGWRPMGPQGGLQAAYDRRLQGTSSRSHL